MTLFLSGNIHQGTEIFSVHSRDKQCAFMGLSSLLTTHIINRDRVVKYNLNTVYIVRQMEDQNYGKLIISWDNSILPSYCALKVVSTFSVGWPR